MIVAGLGFRRDVTAEEIEAVIALALGRLVPPSACADAVNIRHCEPGAAGAKQSRAADVEQEALDCFATLAMTEGKAFAGALDALATLAEKAREPGLLEAARRLSLAVIPCSREAMIVVQDRIVTLSARAEAAVGLPSVAEAAALVAAGASSRLLLARVATANATCAIAGGNSP